MQQWPEPGKLKGWSIERQLGSGGFGAVYLARRADESGALKLLKEDVLSQVHEQQALEILEREVVNLSRVPTNERVARLLDFRLSREPAFLVMEYVEGKDLGDWVKEHGPLDGDHVRDLAHALLEALAHVHAAGVVHRDIKPANVRMRPGGGLVLLDFGIGAHATRTASVLGFDMAFAPPEMLRFAADPDHGAPPNACRWDVFSAGALLCWLFQGPAGQTRGAPRDPGPAAGPLRALILQMTASDPNQRPENGQEALARLRGLATTERVQEPAVDAAVPLETALPSAGSGWRIVGLLLGVVAGLAALWLWRAGLDGDRETLEAPRVDQLARPLQPEIPADLDGPPVQVEGTEHVEGEVWVVEPADQESGRTQGVAGAEERSLPSDSTKQGPMQDGGSTAPTGGAATSEANTASKGPVPPDVALVLAYPRLDGTLFQAEPDPHRVARRLALAAAGHDTQGQPCQAGNTNSACQQLQTLPSASYGPFEDWLLSQGAMDLDATEWEAVSVFITGASKPAKKALIVGCLAWADAPVEGSCPQGWLPFYASAEAAQPRYCFPESHEGCIDSLAGSTTEEVP